MADENTTDPQTSESDGEAPVSTSFTKRQPRSPHLRVTPTRSQEDSGPHSKRSRQSSCSSTRPVASFNVASNRGRRDSRGPRQLSPQEYVQSVLAHSRRSVWASLYPGQNFIDLAAWLQSSREERKGKKDTHCLAVLCSLSPDVYKSSRYFQVDSLAALVTSPPATTSPSPEKEYGRVLFLRGCPPPYWLATLGGRFGIDPEFMRRHLDFFASLTKRSAFSLPSLPSTTRNIITLKSCTIVTQDVSVTPVSKQAPKERRREEAETMAAYRRNYQTTCQAGDSVVREFWMVDEQTSILEQNISICVQDTSEGWLALVWLDIGKDLNEGPPGPWKDQWSVDKTRNREFLSVIQHNAKMTLRQGSIENAIFSGDTEHPLGSEAERARIRQSAAILPFEFERFIDRKAAGRNPFYALHAIFQHVAFAEAQVLNLLEAQLEREMGVLTTERFQSHSLENLQFFNMILDRHIRRTYETLRIVKAKGGSMWPAGRGEEDAVASAAARSLAEDFEDLLTRSRDLRTRCTEGMGIMMNRAVVAESRQAIKQAERLKRLTLLASFFIPLSFTTSLFGMNFKEFGQGRLSVWLFAVVAIPVLLLSYWGYAWDERWLAVYKSFRLRGNQRLKSEYAA